MHTTAKSNLVFTSLFSFDLIASIQPASGNAELNQQLSQALIRSINRRQSLGLLAKRLIAIADQAHPFRQMDVVEQASDILLSLPLPREIRSIASYYKAFCLKRRGELDKARAIFERVVDEVPQGYRAKAIIALGSVAFDRSDFQSATPLYIEGNRTAMCARKFDPLVVFYAQSALAILKSIDGNHKDALSDLEKMLPLIRAVGTSYPPLYYNHLNSLAVEMIEVGQITEAQNICKIMLASPLASAYPEWRETCNDLAMRGYRMPRSFVSITKSPLKTKNIVRLPVRDQEGNIGSVKSLPKQQSQPARILDYSEFLKKMGKEPNGDKEDKKPHQELTDRQMVMRIMDYAITDGLPDEALAEMLDAVRKITEAYEKKKP